MVLSVDMQATHAVQMIHALSYETSDHLHVYNHWWSVCLTSCTEIFTCFEARCTPLTNQQVDCSHLEFLDNKIYSRWASCTRFWCSATVRCRPSFNCLGKYRKMRHAIST